MLAPLSEMTAWSLEEARAALLKALPTGWAFSILHRNPFRAVIKDGDAVVWTGDNYEERLLILDAYGYMATRQAPEPTFGPWVPRRAELTSEVVLSHAMTPDPPDIDPAELAVAYSIGGSDDD
jgi:hypothetical protein